MECGATVAHPLVDSESAFAVTQLEKIGVQVENNPGMEFEAKYKKLLSALTEAVFIVDYESGIILYCNAAAFELTAFSKAELFGVNVSSLFCSGSEAVGGSVEQFLGCSEGQAVNAVLMTKLGVKKQVSVRLNTLMFSKRKLIQLIVREVPAKRDVDELLIKIMYKLSGLSPGDSVIYGSHERCFNVFESLLYLKLPSLCIIHGDPQKVIGEHNVPVESVRLLASKSVKGFSVLPNLQELSLEFSKFLSAYKGGVILLDGLEHLIGTYGFATVYQFIQEKHFDLLEHDSFLLMPMNLDALSRVERAYLASEVKIIEGN